MTISSVFVLRGRYSNNLREAAYERLILSGGKNRIGDRRFSRYRGDDSRGICQFRGGGIHSSKPGGGSKKETGGGEREELLDILDNIAGAAIFLASRAGTFNVGSNIVVDGGESVRGVQRAFYAKIWPDLVKLDK